MGHPAWEVYAVPPRNLQSQGGGFIHVSESETGTDTSVTGSTFTCFLTSLWKLVFWQPVLQPKSGAPCWQRWVCRSLAGCSLCLEGFSAPSHPNQICLPSPNPVPPHGSITPQLDSAVNSASSLPTSATI